MENSLLSSALLPLLDPPAHDDALAGLTRSAFAAYLASLRTGSQGLRALVVLPRQQEAKELQNDLAAYGLATLLLPHWETLPYEALHTYAPVFAQRAAALQQFASTPSCMIVPLAAFLLGVPDATQSASLALHITKGQHIDVTELGAQLVQWGYSQVPRVSLRGEFAFRGEVIDIYSYESEHPLRMSLEYDEVAALRFFDPLTQLSVAEQSGVYIRCAREFSSQFSVPALPPPWAKILTEEKAGAEYIFPLLSKRNKLSEYLDENDHLIFYDPVRIEEEAHRLHNDFHHCYHRSHSTLPSPDLILHGLNDMSSPTLSIYAAQTTEVPRWYTQDAHHFAGNVSLCKETLSDLEKKEYKLLLTASGELQAQRLAHLLDNRSVLPLRLSRGFILKEEKIALFTDRDILGYRHTPAPVSLQLSKSKKLSSLTDLAEGSYVVHINHGIGRFKGIKRMKTGGSERDYISLIYAEEEHLFVPIEQMNLVQHYMGEEQPRLDVLGGTSWQKRKTRIKKSLEDLAEKLIRLYAHRETVKGHAYAPDTEWQEQFESLFPFEETEDQLQSIQEIKADMERSVPMDRLLCGDVGFGKTEVALRAIFKAVMDGRQVVFLAPTTILVEQHFERVRERMQRFPVKIAMLSRFVAKAEQKKVIHSLKEGSIDVVVGTHRLLQKDIDFKLLGLIVVDEEQRFGVSAKERLKELKGNVDYLMLSATPIPRTMHMSMLNIRNMSVLQEAPHDRKPIHTVVKAFSPEEVHRAITQELQRGGQVYYLHNRIDSLQDIQDFIQSLVPEASSEIAHGQMQAAQLEGTMYRFVHGAFNVLIATSIIENGLDIPNVNTIIIDRADHYGVAQLYQLRGRVGRSDKLAYAYLFYPDANYLSEVAQRRLEVIRDHTELGSGFQVAIRDMEIRGVGNLLGRQQSGNACAIGLELYLSLLESSIRTLTTAQDGESEREVRLELEYCGFIPDDYIKEPMLKMGLYKRIASVDTEHELDKLIADTRDRFGAFPKALEELFIISRIRILCATLGITSIQEREGKAVLEFSPRNNISLEKIVTLLQDVQSGVSMGADTSQLLIDMSSCAVEKRASHLRELLAMFQ